MLQAMKPLAMRVYDHHPTPRQLCGVTASAALKNMVAMAGIEMPLKAVRSQIGSALT